MSSDRSTNANLLIMNNLTPNNQNPPLILKNPWWVKITPHIVIISELLNLLIDKNWISLIVVFLWIWYGNKLQKNKIIANDILKLLLILIVTINIPSLLSKLPKILQMLSALLWAFFIFYAILILSADRQAPSKIEGETKNVALPRQHK